MKLSGGYHQQLERSHLHSLDLIYTVSLETNGFFFLSPTNGPNASWPNVWLILTKMHVVCHMKQICSQTHTELHQDF